ncbi:MAG: CpsD/CapB family tyrosine-protein kinase [Melioribacteraceae bacterium]
MRVFKKFFYPKDFFIPVVFALLGSLGCYIFNDTNNIEYSHKKVISLRKKNIADSKITPNDILNWGEILSNYLEDELPNHIEKILLNYGLSEKLFFNIESNGPNIHLIFTTSNKKLEDSVFSTICDTISTKYTQVISNELYIHIQKKVISTVSDNRMIKVAYWGLIGGFIGIFIVALKNNLNKNIKNLSHYTFKKELFILGQIPEIKLNENNEINGFMKINFNQNNISEEFKKIRSIIHNKIGYTYNSSYSFLISSAISGEGKTTILLNLAIHFAMSNKRIVIIDCDLRRPNLHSIFKQKRFPGFTDYFVGKAKFEEIYRSTEIDNLFFIPAGTIPPNPTEILDSRGMKSFIRKLKNEFDLVFIDAPPHTLFYDSFVLSEIVDYRLLVVRQNFISESDLDKVVEELKPTNSTLLGIIHNYIIPGFNNNITYYYPRYTKVKKKKNVKLLNITNAGPILFFNKYLC